METRKLILRSFLSPGDMVLLTAAVRDLHLAHPGEQPFAMTSFPLLELEGAFCQHDFSGRIVFQHRCGDKWNFYRDNPGMSGFQFERECLADLRRLRSIWDGEIAVLR